MLHFTKAIEEIQKLALSDREVADFLKEEARDDHGRWTAGGGAEAVGGGKGPGKFGAAAAQASAKAKEAAGKAAQWVKDNPDKIKGGAHSAIASGLSALINHYTGGAVALDPSHQKEAIRSVISNVSLSAKVSMSNAKDSLVAAATTLREARAKMLRKADDDEDDIVAVLQWVIDALNAHDVEDDGAPTQDDLDKISAEIVNAGSAEPDPADVRAIMDYLSSLQKDATAGDVHTSTALGNQQEKKPKAQDFDDLISEMSGNLVDVDPDDVGDDVEDDHDDETNKNARQHDEEDDDEEDDDFDPMDIDSIEKLYFYEKVGLIWQDVGKAGDDEARDDHGRWTSMGSMGAAGQAGGRVHAVVTGTGAKQELVSMHSHLEDAQSTVRQFSRPGREMSVVSYSFKGGKFKPDAVGGRTAGAKKPSSPRSKQPPELLNTRSMTARRIKPAGDGAQKRFVDLEKGAPRQLKMRDDGMAHTPFPHDQNFFSNIRPDQVPRFLGALTNQDAQGLKDMNLGSLTATQDRVDPDKVDAMRQSMDEGDEHKPPLVVRTDGRNYIADGHHRAAAMYTAGVDKAPCRFLDLSPVSAAVKRASDTEKRFRAVKACPECGVPAGAFHKESCSGHVLGDVGKLGDDADWILEGEVIKADPDKQLVFGWASISSQDGEHIVDKQGDIIPEAELETAAYEFALYHRAHGDMHDRMGVGRMIESMMFTVEKQQALGIDLGLVGWWIGFRVDDADVWKRIKEGKLPEFSIGGKATREELPEGSTFKRRSAA